MKKLILTFSFIVFLFPWVEGQEKPVLKFNSKNRFKIVQFTDIHFRGDSYRSDSALVLMQKVVEREKPDLLVLTGDVVCSENAKKAWLQFSQFMVGLQVPWAVTLGNHDPEYEMTSKQIIDFLEGLPYCVTESGPSKISGNGNYVLPIKSAKSHKTAALCYLFDSQSSFVPETTNRGVYEWIDFSQIVWYREQSAAYAEQNKGTPLPALAFFHIPFPEYKEVIGKSTTVGLQQEKVCSPDLNSGLYTAMLECKDVMGVFVGHDHNNNYIGCLRDICLAYGQVSGRQSYGDIGRGARVIELYEGQRKFDTWILKLYDCNRDTDFWQPTNSQERMFFVTYPDSFAEPAAKK
jgi:hypothetical protein